MTSMTTTTTHRDTAALIRARVAREGRSVADVARAASMEPDTLRAKMRGERPLYVSELRALSGALGVGVGAMAREAGL